MQPLRNKQKLGHVFLTSMNYKKNCDTGKKEMNR